MLGILLFVPSLAYLVLLQGCCNGAKKDRSSAEVKSTLSKKEPSKRPIGKPGVDSKASKRPQGVGNPMQQQPPTKENKDEVEPAKAAAAEDGKSGMKEETNPVGSKKGKSSKKGKDRPLEPTQTKTDEEPQKPQEPQQPQQGDQKTEKIEAPPKEPNEFEKAAANEGTVVNPQKVKRMGNIDEIYETKKEEQNKELENLKSVVSSVKNSKDPAAGKKVSINEAKCVLFETADCPTLDDDENDNGEDPL